MKIIADISGQKAIQQLCDIALKHAGLDNFDQVGVVLHSVKPLPSEDKQPKEEKPKEGEKK